MQVRHGLEPDRQVMPNACWQIRDKSVSLIGEDEIVLSTSAADVHAAEFKGIRILHGHSVPMSPKEALPSLRFHRGYATLIIDVFSLPAPCLRRPRCEFRLMVGGTAHIVRAVQLKATDNVIIDGVWIAYSATEVGELEVVLGVDLPTAENQLSLAQIVKLRGTSGTQVRWHCEPTDEDAKAQPATIDTHPEFPYLRLQPFPYQARGIRWLRHLCSEGVGGILADEMGLGKTLQAIAVIAENAAASRKPYLVVTTASLLENWRREFGRFAPQVRLRMHRGSERTGFPKVLSETDCVVTTYDCLVRDEALFQMIEWRTVFLDEAQFTKNPESLRSRAVRGLRRENGIAVTGTPLENRILDLWTLCDFALPGLLGERLAFELMVTTQPNAATLVGEAVSPFMLRRRILDVRKDLPSKHELITAISMSEQEAHQYELLRKETAVITGGRPSFGALMKLRQFCAHPSLVQCNSDVAQDGSLKIQRLLELLETIADRQEKALVFAPFHAALDLLATCVSGKFGISGDVIDGRMPIDERQRAIDQFHVVSGFQVLFLNPRAAGVGLNITAANHVIHFCPEWNPAVVDQATARAYRSGQTLPVSVHRLFYANTVEEVMERRLSSKRDLIEDAVLENDSDPLSASDLINALAASPITSD